MRNSPVRVLLIGAAGRMGKTICDLAENDSDVQIAAQCDLGDAIEPAMKSCGVAIDFSQPDSVDEICRAALKCVGNQRARGGVKDRGRNDETEGSHGAR